MKRYTTPLIFTGLLALLLALSSCENRNSSTARNDAKDQAVSDNTSDQLKNAKEAYQTRIQARLDEFDNRLDQLKNHPTVKNEKNKVAHDRVYNELNMKLNAAKNMFSDIKGANENTWQDMRPAMDKTIGDLESSFDKEGIHVTAGTSTARMSNDNDQPQGKTGYRTTADNTATTTASDNVKKTYVDRMQARIDDFDNRISQIESNVKDASTNDAVKVKNDRWINALKMKTDVAHKILDDIKSADSNTWQSMKSDLDKWVSDTDNTFKKSGFRWKTGSTAKQ